MAPSESRRTSAKPEGLIEVEWVEQGGGDAIDPTWTLFEIWTRNRIYHVDMSLLCTAVVTRQTGKPEPMHPLRGARLTGGERRNKNANLVDVFYPVPSPGTEAVFRSDAKKGQFAKTSTIEKVILRVRRVRITTAAEAEAWDGLLSKSHPR